MCPLLIKNHVKMSYKREAGQKISVITVVFNGVKTLEKTIQSVLDQSYNKIQYIIIDGGSTDGTLDIIRKYEKFIDYWVSEPDHGIYDAMNKGIACATGTWIYFLGADDVLLNALSNIVPYFIAGNVYYGKVKVKQTGEIRGERVSRYSLMLRNIQHQALFYPAFLFDQYFFSARYGILADWALNIRLYSRYSASFNFIDTVVAVYDVSGVSSVQRDHVFDREFEGIILRYFGILFYLIKRFRSLIVMIYKSLRAI